MTAGTSKSISYHPPSSQELNVGDPQPDLTASTKRPPIPEKSYELRIFQSLRRIIRAIELHSRKLATDHKITGPQLVCLLALKEQEPLTLKKLAQLVFLSPSTVVGIVDRLEEKGLVGRSRSVVDRRSVFISVTESGNRMLANAPLAIQESLARALKRLPEKEMVSITMALEKIVDMMEASGIDAAPVLQTGCLSADPNKNTF